MKPTTNREWILSHRPVGDIADGDLVMRTSPSPNPREGEVLMRTTYLSLDPTNRIWMSDMDQCMEPVRVGEPMRGVVLGEVVDSRAGAFKTGDQVMALGSWSDYFCSPPAQCIAVPRIPPGSTR